jgi:hypothetical protein
MSAVNLDELTNAATIVDEGEGMAKALVSRETGMIHLLNEEYMDEEAPMPSDAQGTSKYVLVPPASALGLGGEALVARFAASHLPGDEATVHDLLREQDDDGFARLLEERGAAAAWSEFREQQTRAVLQRWCEEHGLDCT